jgi:hypothetical protein
MHASQGAQLRAPDSAVDVWKERPNVRPAKPKRNGPIVRPKVDRIDIGSLPRENKRKGVISFDAAAVLGRSLGNERDFPEGCSCAKLSLNVL